jgi:LPS-assembly protein
LLSRDWDRFSVALSSLYRQDPYLGHGNLDRDRDETVQQLPALDAYLHRGRIFPSLPLEVDVTAQFAYMYRRYGTRGARYEVVPRLTLPINTRYGSIIASGGLYQTFYDTDRKSRMVDDRNSSYSRQNGENRTLPEFTVAGMTEFAKVYWRAPEPLTLTPENVGASHWLGLRHSVQPRVEYRFRSNEEQDDNPHYTSDDRMGPESQVVYSLTNVLTAKTEEVALKKDDKGEMVPELKTSYHDVARLRLEQAYNIREANRDHDREEYERRPFGDIFADLTLSPNPYFAMTTRNNWSPYLHEFTRHQSGVSATWPEVVGVYVGYDLRKALDEYTRKRDYDVRYLRLDFTTAQVGPLSLKVSLKHDYKTLDNRETDIDLIYTHQCFKFIGRVSVDPQEENYQILVMLTGLGD